MGLIKLGGQDILRLGLKYTGKLLYAGFAGATTTGAVTLVTDLLDNGRIDLGSNEYFKAMRNSALGGAAIALAYCAYDFVTWDRFPINKKIEILETEFKEAGRRVDIIYTSDLEKYGHALPTGQIELSPKGFANLSIARNTLIHERTHLFQTVSDDINKIRAQEQIAHMVDIGLSQEHQLPSRYWRGSYRLYKSYGGTEIYHIPIELIWYNYFR